VVIRQTELACGLSTVAVSKRVLLDTKYKPQKISKTGRAFCGASRLSHGVSSELSLFTSSAFFLVEGAIRRVKLKLALPVARNHQLPVPTRPWVVRLLGISAGVSDRKKPETLLEQDIPNITTSVYPTASKATY
jgi:hypothetical protein